MWKIMKTAKGVKVTSRHLNLKNTLMNGQCFNWKEVNISEVSYYVGCVDKNVILLKEDTDTHTDTNNLNNKPKDRCIYYQFLHKSGKNVKEQDFFDNYFQLSIDTEPIYALAKENLPKNLQSVMDQYTGIRIINQETFECIISFICSSNNNIDRIRKMLDSFRQKYGELLYTHEDYGSFYSFPSLVDLKKQKIEEEDFKAMGFGYRAKYIVQSLEMMSEEWIENIKTSEKPLEELLKLTGVGRKVADCILLFTLQKHHVVPLDIHMINFYNESITPMRKFKKIEGINKKSYEEVSRNYIKVFGDYAGWLHSIFYMSRIDKSAKKGKRKADILEEEVSEEKQELKLKKKKVKKV